MHFLISFSSQYRPHPGLPASKLMLAPEPPELPPLEVIYFYLYIIEMLSWVLLNIYKTCYNSLSHKEK